MQPHKQQRESVHQPVCRLVSEALRPHRTIGKRKLEVSGDKHRRKLVANFVLAIRDDCKRLNAGDIEFFQLLQDLVLTPS